MGRRNVDASGVTRIQTADRLRPLPAGPPAGTMQELMIGDVIDKPGRLAVTQRLPELRRARGIDFVTANGENLADGMGLTAPIAEAMLESGVEYGS